MAVASPREPARRVPHVDAGRRVRYVDAVRGVALVLMVVNHTARWWLDPAVGPGRDTLIYATMVLAGPTFLLLVGLSLALSHRTVLATAVRPCRATAGRALRRAGGLVAAGALVNVLVFPESAREARVLISIGLGLALAAPLASMLHRAPSRWGLAALAPAIYAGFLAARPRLAEWSATHPVAADLILREFPMFPWFGLLLIGLPLGWAVGAAGGGERDRLHGGLAILGALGLLAWLALGRGQAPGARLHAGRDVVLNGYWTAGPATATAMLGAILLLLAGAYVAVERCGWRLVGLVLLGRTALALYVVHLIVIRPLAGAAGGLALASWPAYALATGLLLLGLGGVARTWRST